MKTILTDPKRLSLLAILNSKMPYRIHKYDGVFKDRLVLIVSATLRFVECYTFKPSTNEVHFEKIPFSVFAKHFTPFKP